MSQTNKTKNTRPKAMGRRGFLLTASAAMMFAADAHAGPFAGRTRPLAGRLGRWTGGDGAVKTLDTVSLTDPSRGRTFLLRAYHPAEAGTYPTIVFSHGFGADMSAFEQTSRDWAAQGYVVIHPTHADSVRYPDPAAPPGSKAALLGSGRAQRTARLGRLRPGTGGDNALVSQLEDPFYLKSRLADISFIVGLLEAGSGIDSALHARVKRGTYGMAGHSYGAYTSEVLAGARLSTPERNASTSLMAKFTTFMAISGQGSGRLDLTPDSFGTIGKPFFGITGTEDTGADGETPEWRLEPYYKCAPGNKFAAVVRGFNHLSFDSNGEGSKTLRAMQINFWDAWLGGESAAGNHLLTTAKHSNSADTVWLRTR